MHFLKNFESEIMDFDPDKMEDIVLNILYNAIKFTPPGGDIYMTCDTTVSPSQGRRLVMRIRDTGIGIPENKWNMIFERFYQIEDKSAPVREGSGIGLTVVKEYLKLMGGNIEVSSKINEGTEFVLTLPITKNSNVFEGQFFHPSDFPVADWSEEIHPTSTLRVGEPFDQYHTILIVEDNVELSHYLRSVIAPHFNTEVAINGQDGIEKALAIIPDLILSDVMMPVKDGYELCDTLKKDYKTNHIPIILLTARADSESKITGFQRGADDYISKPFQSKELLVRIRKMIEQREKLKLKYSLSHMEVTGDENHLSLDDMFIAEILQHLENNYTDEYFGIDELCSAMKISRVQLHRKLIALTGLSASHFINKFRLEKAVKLLKSTRNTVSEIAFDVGFHDSNYFSRVFSKVFGVSPGDFRKQKQ
ncbi:MAG: response regulator [Saprospiraceae bacterium]|nr:response regulator [Saprospiraceae bacterium]